MSWCTICGDECYCNEPIERWFDEDEEALRRYEARQERGDHDYHRMRDEQCE